MHGEYILGAFWMKIRNKLLAFLIKLGIILWAFGIIWVIYFGMKTGNIFSVFGMKMGLYFRRFG